MATYKGLFLSCDGQLIDFTAQNCRANWGTFYRLAMIRPDATTTLPTFTATDILLSATWTAAIGASGANKLIVTPAGLAYDYNREVQDATTDQSPLNGRKILVRENPNILTFTFENFTSDNEDALLVTNNSQLLRWFYINDAGRVIAKPNGQPFESVFNFASSRMQNPSQADRLMIQLESFPAQTVDWAEFDCSAFILTL